MSAVARYYDKEKNAEGASLAGVPLRDLTEEDFEALPAHLQRSVDALPFYRRTNPNPTRRKAEPKSEAAEAPATDEKAEG
jgi:hypothetical protein